MANKKDKTPPKAAKRQATKRKDTEDQGKGAQRRVAQLKSKLTEAMQDPLTRDQIVRAIRAMMQEK